MIDTTRTFASFSVDDLETARRFYGDTLGMRVSDAAEGGPLWLHGPDDHDILVYSKPDHVPATFTVLNFAVNNIKKTVDELTAVGVRLERYAGYEMDERGIYHRDGHSTAWFTDPAGNILSVVQLG